jgi:hypothetical protein
MYCTKYSTTKINVLYIVIKTQAIHGLIPATAIGRGLKPFDVRIDPRTSAGESQKKNSGFKRGPPQVDGEIALRLVGSWIRY